MVRVLVSLRAGRESAIGCPKVDQRLHRFQLLRLEHVQRAGGQHEVTEAAVQLLLEVQVVEGIDKVRPVQVGVYPEHLPEDSLADLHEVLRETTSLTDPFLVAGVR